MSQVAERYSLFRAATVIGHEDIARRKSVNLSSLTDSGTLHEIALSKKPAYLLRKYFVCVSFLRVCKKFNADCLVQSSVFIGYKSSFVVIFLFLANSSYRRIITYIPFKGQANSRNRGEIPCLPGMVYRH